MEPAKDAEAELESFRRQWREEVYARARQENRSAPDASAQPSAASPERRKKTVPPHRPTERRIDPRDEEVEPRGYHDLPDKEAELKMGAAEHGLTRGAMSKEPKSALEHYEKAVEKEVAGSLGDSLRLYRTAFKMDDNVHEKYKNKHFPPSSFAPKPAVAPGTSTTTSQQTQQGLPATISQLVEEFSQLSIPGAEPSTDPSPAPPCPIKDLPEEILTTIIQYIAISDVAAMSRVSRICKRFAFLVMTEEQIWRRVSMESAFGFKDMHYDFTCDIEGKPLSDDINGRLLGTGDDDLGDEDFEPATPKPSYPDITSDLLRKQYASSWRQMYRSRPRVRFGGCYISTVNYTRPGAASTSTNTWGAPVHIVTYFRYLRFFRDGTAISLLTTAEPVDVVHHLTKANLHKEHKTVLPSVVMKDAVRGRWRLTGPGDGVETEEAEGDLIVDTECSIPKYTCKMQFTLGNAGKGTRNNKLNWKGYWYHNKLTDDWGEFGLKNDKGFYWSRVKSYRMGS